MRAKKTPEEVSRMKHAAGLVEEVLRRGLNHVKSGVSEIELVAELEYLMKRSAPPVLPSTLWSSVVLTLPFRMVCRETASSSRVIF